MATHCVPRGGCGTTRRFLGLVLSLCVPVYAGAADILWDGGAAPAGFDGIFSTVANWSDLPNLPDRAPSVNDVAHFGTTGMQLSQNAYTVTFTTDPTNQALVVEDDNVTLNLDAHVYTLSAANPVTIGQSSTFPSFSGRLTISDGTVAVSGSGASFEVGINRAGFLTVTTGGLLAGTGMSLFVGRGTNGTFTINGGGDVLANYVNIGSSQGSVGTSTISGIGSAMFSSQLIVGERGTGTLTVFDRGQIESNAGDIGDDPAGVGTVHVNGAGSTWDNSGVLTVGSRGTGTLNIAGGGRVESGSGGVGMEDNSNGTLNISGIDSQWIISGPLIVGNDGQGTMIIGANGKVQNTNGFIGVSGPLSTVSVEGLNAQWINSGELQIGERGEGALIIGAQGLVQSTNALVGNHPNGRGDVMVDGDNAQWVDSGTVNIGYFGPGALKISGGGQVHGSAGSIGNRDGSVGSVEVLDDSRWMLSGELRIGEAGSGTLVINAGGEVQNNNGSIAVGTGSGHVIVDGANAQWTSNSTLSIGESKGDARLAVSDGGRVHSRDSFLGREDQSSVGEVEISGAGSIWTIDGKLSLGGDLFTGIDGGMGTLRIQPGGSVNVVQNTKLFDDGRLHLEGGTLSTSGVDFQGGGQFLWSSGTLHVGVFQGDLTVPNGGTLAPGNSAGGTVVNGVYTQQLGAALAIEIGGTAAITEHDRLLVQGNAVLGGTLQLSKLGGFVPSPTDRFVIFEAFNPFGITSVSGAFANVANGQRLTTSDGLGSFRVHYGPGSQFNPLQVVLSDFVAGGVPGDYNHDGTVNAADYTVWRDHLGQSFTLTNENPTAATPGVVDAEDYDFWKAHFGDPFSSGSGATATSIVPEPTTLALLILMATCWGIQRGRSA